MRYRIVFLGTGTADNEERCQSAYALVNSEGAFVLFDTGSGLETLRQIVRAGLEPTMLGAIFLTHRHWDHTAGLFPLLLWLRLRYPEVTARITVHGSAETMAAMAEMHRLSGHRGRFFFRDLAPEQAVTLWNDCDVEAIAVEHISGSLGYRVGLAGNVLVLSGDTAPAETVVSAAREADILIHEASFDQAQRDKAEDLRHTTAAQAGALARRARVKKLILTHLVPDRLIPGAKLQMEAEAAFGGRVEMAEDLWSLALPG